MSTLETEQEVLQQASTLSSIAFNNDHIHLLIIGAGRGGLAMLNVMRDYDWVNIYAIVDLNEQAFAFPLAHSLGIQTSTDRHQTLNEFKGDIVIDVTGDSSLAAELTTELENRQTELIAGKSAKLVFDLVHLQLNHTRTIHSQNRRLDLLDSMLEITTQLENQPQLADILHTSLSCLQNHIQAEQSLVMMFNADGTTEITHAEGKEKTSSSNRTICSKAQAICSNINQHHRFKVLTQPIIDNTISYNIMIPLWHQESITAALLISIPGELDREQRTALNMSSVHLNTAVKTLQQYKQLESMAINDALTGLYNRRYFDQKLHEEVNRIQRKELATLSCVFVDVDNFKEINDQYGHQTGDTAIREIAKSLLHSIRDYDTCARFGGDEFVLLLPADSLTEEVHIEHVGLRMLQHISEIKIPHAPELKLSASIGIATQSSETLNGETLLKMADLAVYQAKAAGKGCLHIHIDEQFHYSEKNS